MQKGSANKKHERRSLFRSSAVLTALIVILLIFAALTTATFAWFSSNRSVTAGTTEFTANNSDGAGSINIYWGATKNGEGLSIRMEDMQNMAPTTPNMALSVGDKLNKQGFKFQTAIQSGEGNDATFASVRDVSLETVTMTGRTSAPAGQEGERKDFFTVANVGTAAIQSTFRMKVTFPVDDLSDFPNSDILRIAVFVATENPTSLGSYAYKGTFGYYGANSSTYYGTIADGDRVNDQQTYAATDKVDLIDGLEANGKVYVKLLAWFDGHMLTVNRAGGSAKATVSVELV